MKRRAVLAVMNRKGGCGKTTLAVSLAVVFAESRKTTLIDADSQASASAWAGAERVVLAATPAALRAAVEAVPDFAIIDGPPFDLEMNRAAFALATAVLVPVSPSPLDVSAARPVLLSALEARRPVLAVLSLVDTRTVAAREDARRTLEGFGAKVARTEIARRIAHVDAVTARLPVTSYAPASLAAAEIRALADEVSALLK